MNEAHRITQAGAIDTANNALMDAGLPSYDDLLGAMRDANDLMNHAGVPPTRSVQRLREFMARIDAVAQQAA